MIVRIREILHDVELVTRQSVAADLEHNKSFHMQNCMASLCVWVWV